MKRFVPLEKMSKKAQKEYYAKKRGTWGEISPVTRTVPNGKAYSRSKMKQEEQKNSRYDGPHGESSPAVFILLI